MRGRDRWLDLARLKGRPEHVRPLVIVDERSRFLSVLETALESGERSEALRLAEQCWEKTKAPNATAIDREMLALAAGRTLLIVAADVEGLQRADACLTGLDDRPDLPEAYVLHQTISLRIAARSEQSQTLSSDDIDRFRRRLPDFPQEQIFLAECWYHFARGSRGSADGAWQSCLKCADAYMKIPGTPATERRAAELLRTLARLMLKTKSDVTPSTDPWLACIQLTAHSMRASQGPRVRRTKAPSLTDPAPMVLRPEDEAIVRIARDHAAGRPADEAMFARLSGWKRDRFFAIRLLYARQARLKGRANEAAAEYTRLFEEASESGPDFLLDVADAESKP